MPYIKQKAGDCPLLVTYTLPLLIYPRARRTYAMKSLVKREVFSRPHSCSYPISNGSSVRPFRPSSREFADPAAENRNLADRARSAYTYIYIYIPARKISPAEIR